MKRGGHFWDPPDMKRPRDRGGPKMEWARSVCPLEAPPLRVVWERERGDSLPHRQKNGSRTECRSTAVALCGGAISSCRVAQKNRGGASFLHTLLLVCVVTLVTTREIVSLVTVTALDSMII